MCVRPSSRGILAIFTLLSSFGSLACKGSSASSGAPHGSASVASATREGAPPLSTIVVDHGELDTKAPDNSPKLASTVIAATVYKLPDTASRRLGYVRLGGVVNRDPEPVRGKGCKKDWYRVYPMGYVCGDDATTDLDDPVVRAASRRPDLDKPLPYKYGFVRATAPQYLRVPTRAEQLKSEFQLEEHLAWYAEHKHEVQTVVLGANDVPLDARGIATPGAKHPPGFRPSTSLSENELFGGSTADDPIPFWLQNGRQIPNVSTFQVPPTAYFADRVRRKTGLSFVGAFNTSSDGLERRFAITVDLRLIPTTKVKPDTGSPFHGVELANLPFPFAWVIVSDAQSYRLIKDKNEVRAVEPVPKRVIVPLSGTARIKAGHRYYQTARDKTLWLRASDISVVAEPPTFPEAAEKGEKWIDVSLRQQTLVLYEGKKPVYATLVSTGRDRLGDPKQTMATPQGAFRLQSKHIAAAMDSEENSSVAGGTRANTSAPRSADAAKTIERLKRAQANGEKLSEDDRRRLINIEKGRDPEYGVTVRRGASGFELRDVPWIQYFSSGYALHGAYWHDVFGFPRSHGCINLAPIDARYVFMWTDPPVPAGWHGINIGSDMGQGTLVVVRE
jgi:hypothetical protein